jgi:hypothetical protein
MTNKNTTNQKVQIIVDNIAAAANALPFPHLAAELQILAAQDSAARIEAVRSDWVVRHPAVRHAMNCARWLIEGPRRVRTTGLLVLGDVGAGKTTLARLITRQYAGPNVIREARHEPVVTIGLTGARHMRAVYGRILEALDGPVKASHHTSDREFAALRLLRSVQCRCLIVDEVQDVLAGSRIEQRRTLDGLKFIMNEVQLPIIALGTTNAAHAFQTDTHMASRFQRVDLPQWEAGHDLANLLIAVARLLPLRKPSVLASKKIMKMLVANSNNGRLDDIMTMLRLAAVQAILTGTERITLAMLELATAVPNMEEIDHA